MRCSAPFSVGSRNVTHAVCREVVSNQSQGQDQATIGDQRAIAASVVANADDRTIDHDRGADAQFVIEGVKAHAVPDEAREAIATARQHRAQLVARAWSGYVA